MDRKELINENEALKRKISELENNEATMSNLKLLQEMATDASLFNSSIDEALKKITCKASAGLDTGRSSVWYYQDSESSIRCMELYEKSTNNHSSGMILYSKDYPSYFEAIKSNRVIAAHSALSDSRTCEFAETYLKPLGISSMLDAPIMISGSTYGVICFEHTGTERIWTAEEMSFAAAVADTVALVIESHERKNAERRLEKETELLHTLIDNLPDSVYFKDGESRFILNNSTHREFMNVRSNEEAFGKTDHDFFPAELADKFREDEKKVLKGKPILNRVEMNISPTGDKRWYETSKVPVKNKEGEIVSMVGISRDITERKEADRLLDQTRQLYTTLFKQFTDWVLIMDNEFIIDCNDRAVELIGCGKKENLIGKTPFDLSPVMQPDGQPTDKKGLRYIRKVLNGNPQNFYWKHKTADGTLLDMDINLDTINMDGKKYIQAVCRDISQKKQAENALRASEERFRSMVECLHDGVIIMEDEKVVYVNERITQILGYSAEEMMNISPMQLVIEEDRADLKKHITAYAGKNQLPAETHYWVRRKDGEKRFIKNRFSSSEKNEDKKLQFIVVTDITEQEYAKQALIESEKRYRMVFDHSPIGIGITRLDGEIIAVNEKARDIFGSSVVDEAGLNIKDYYANSNDRKLFISKMKNEGGVKNLELELCKDNGKKLIGRVTSSSVKLGDEVVILTILEDITEIKEAQANLIKLSNAIEQSPSVVVITDLNGVIEYANPSFTRQTGYKLEDVNGENASILKSGNMPDAIYANLWDKLKNGRTWTGEFQNRKKNGELYWEYVKISSIMDDSGQPRYYLKVAEDITEQKKLREDLIQAKELAEQSDRLKSAFLMNLSHEVRTPLNAILGFTSLLKSQIPLNETASSYTDHITAGGNQLLKIIENTVDMARLENNEYTVFKNRSDLCVCLNNVFEKYLQAAKKDNPLLGFELDIPEEALVLETDHRTLEKVVGNLLDNAIKFTDTGKVNLGTRENDNEIQIYVEDTGIGISEDMRTRIFEKFIKVENKERLFEGSGLGLTISRGLSRLLGGDIKVESKPGGGSKFTITIPNN